MDEEPRQGLKQVPRLAVGLVLGGILALTWASPVVDETTLPLHPVRIVIPEIDVDAHMEQLGVTAKGKLRSPVEAERVGWFSDSPVPGELGSAIVVGHLDAWNGPGVFWRLGDLQAGNQMIVTRSDGVTETFEVIEVRRVRRENFPTNDVYGALPDRALRLITCGGLYDPIRSRYMDNLIVTALAV